MSETTETGPTSSQTSRQLEYVEPEDGIFRTYANHHRFGSTGYDVRLLFGEIIDVADDKIIIEETVHVTMSWQQAKELLDTLRAIFAEHEGENKSESPEP